MWAFFWGYGGFARFLFHTLAKDIINILRTWSYLPLKFYHVKYFFLESSFEWWEQLKGLTKPKPKFVRSDQCEIVCVFFVQVSLDPVCPPLFVQSKRRVCCLSTFAWMSCYVKNVIRCIQFFHFSFAHLSYSIWVTSFPEELITKCCLDSLLYKKDYSDQ